MVSSIAFAHRRADLDRSQFDQHWNEIHGPLIARLDYLRGYTQNMVAPPRALPPGLAAAPFDGIAGFYWDDLDAARRPAEDPEFTEHGKLDEPNFLDLERLTLIETEPTFLKPVSGSAAIKAIMLLAPATGGGEGRFGEHCRGTWASSSPAGLDGCVVHVALDSRAEPAAAVIETWWSEVGDYDAWVEGPGAGGLFGADAVDAARSSIFFAREHHVIQPPHGG